jgi:hypothetical protein
VSLIIFSGFTDVGTDDNRTEVRAYGTPSFLQISRHSRSQEPLLPSIMEQEGSLPFQQELVIGPYPESDASNPHLPSFNIVTRV